MNLAEAKELLKADLLTEADLAALRGKLAAERERCANILPPQTGKADEDLPDDKEEAYHLGYADALTDVAAAIRKEA